ncbi:MAG: hypothetical protein B6I37_07275 [Desulfobacteraceae bacterium 4572_35.2]|nr:MAG: hypothetical protein B6I37_07275 [Desulfobacteraceae bacterium 4572_35.2]
MHLLNRLSTLEQQLFCYLDDGPLKSILLERYLDEADAHDDIMELDLDASLLIKNSVNGSTATIMLRLEYDEFLYQTTLCPTALDTEQSAELLALLNLHGPKQTTTKTSSNKNIIRKKQGENLLNVAQASKALGLSQRQIKRIIPCSEIRIVDNYTSKSIEDYYWDTQLIQRFSRLRQQQQQGCRYSDDDINYVAKKCCEEDVKWARDTIAIFLRQCTKE